MPWLSVRMAAVLGLGLLIGTVAGSAHAQVDSREGIALQNQIYQLRQELQQMRDQPARGGGGSSLAPQPAYRPPPSGDIVTQLLTRVEALEEQVRELRGQLDRSQHLQQQQSADLSKRIDDMAFQTRPGGPAPSYTAPSYNAPSYASPPPSAGPGTAPAPPPASVRRTPEIALQDGNAALARRDYTAAEAAAREVLTARTSPRAYDAQFLLAQALAGQRQYAQSAIAYDDAYNRNRKGTHAQDALAGLATTLAALNEKKAACDTLVKLAAEFPQVRPELQNEVSSTRQRAGCR